MAHYSRIGALSLFVSSSQKNRTEGHLLDAATITDLVAAIVRTGCGGHACRGRGMQSAPRFHWDVSESRSRHALEMVVDAALEQSAERERDDYSSHKRGHTSRA